MNAKKKLKKAKKQYAELAKQYYDQQYQMLMTQAENIRLNKLIKNTAVLN